MTTLKSLLAELWGLLLKVGGFYEKHGVPAVAATAGFGLLLSHLMLLVFGTGGYLSYLSLASGLLLIFVGLFHKPLEKKLVEGVDWGKALKRLIPRWEWLIWGMRLFALAALIRGVALLPYFVPDSSSYRVVSKPAGPPLFDFGLGTYLMSALFASVFACSWAFIFRYFRLSSSDENLRAASFAVLILYAVVNGVIGVSITYFLPLLI